jgi:hypothetical protein
MVDHSTDLYDDVSSLESKMSKYTKVISFLFQHLNFNRLQPELRTWFQT